MKITGKLHSFGVLQIAVDAQQTDGWIAKQIRDVKGVLIECTDDATIRDASELFCATVDIYPHPVNELIAGECTPENYAHAMARLAHAEASSPTADHLAREVRSSQALIARVKELEQAAKDRADHDAEDERKRQQRTDEREAAWRKYLDLRKQVRIATAAERPNDEVHALMGEALELGRKYDFDIDREAFADAKKHVAELEAQNAAILAKQAEQERLLSIYRTKYHEADRALQQAHAGLAAAQDLLTGCTPPGMSIREDERGWRVTSDVDTWWYATEQEAHAVAWSDYRDAQTETLADKARAARAGDEDDDSRGRDEEGNALT